MAINELITLVNIALGTAQPSACPHGVPSGADVDVALIIQAVNNALNGCSGADSPDKLESLTERPLSDAPRNVPSGGDYGAGRRSEIGVRCTAPEAPSRFEDGRT